MDATPCLLLLTPPPPATPTAPPGPLPYCLKTTYSVLLCRQQYHAATSTLRSEPHKQPLIHHPFPALVHIDVYNTVQVSSLPLNPGEGTFTSRAFNHIACSQLFEYHILLGQCFTDCPQPVCTALCICAPPKHLSKTHLTRKVLLLFS